MTGGFMNLLNVNEQRNSKVRAYEPDELERMKAYPQENFRRIMNPLAWYVEGGCNSVMYRIKGFTVGELETYDIYHVNHFLQTTKSQGIVSLEYGKDARKQYPNFEQYMKAKEVEGLKAALKYWTDVLELQKVAVAEMKTDGGIDYVNAKERQEQFEELVESIQGWIKEADSEVENKKVETVELKRPKKKVAKTKEETKLIGV